MGKNGAKNRQKKLAKRKAKSRARQKNTRNQTGGSRTVFGKVVGCSIDDQGTGIISVTLAREAGLGFFWVAGFVIDFQCLGVKDSFLSKVTSMQFRAFKEQRELVEYFPQKAKRAVLAGVEYAKSIGFEPHKDFTKSFSIFKGIDAEPGDCEFELGKDGSPLFIAGPFDSPAKCKKILETLEKNCGKGNSRYILTTSEFDEEAGRYVGSEEF